MKRKIEKIFEKRPTILYDIVFWVLVILLTYTVLASIMGWPTIQITL